MPSISVQSSSDDDKICIDRKTFKRLFSIVCSSTDILANARHREVFLDSLDTYLSEPTELDGDDCFRASLLLDAYYEYVPASLDQLGSLLDEAFELMREIRNND